MDGETVSNEEIYNEIKNGLKKLGQNAEFDHPFEVVVHGLLWSLLEKFKLRLLAITNLTRVYIFKINELKN